jgi:DNA-binding response OmpR family regulator
MSVHVLFAEDDDGLRTIVVDELHEAGFTVEPVNDGNFAISSLKSNVYDLVLLDIRMPNKSGVEVLEFMQSENIHTPTIMVTGVDDRSVAIQTLELGASDILTKPFTASDLIGCIDKVLAT